MKPVRRSCSTARTGDGERVSSRQKAPSAKAPLHMVGETPPLGSVWHDASGFESKVDVEVDAAGKEAFSRKYIHVLERQQAHHHRPAAKSVSVPTHLYASANLLAAHTMFMMPAQAPATPAPPQVLGQLVSQVVEEDAAAAKEDRPGAVAAAQIAQAEAAEKSAAELAAAELAEKECRAVLAGLLEQVEAKAEAEAEETAWLPAQSEKYEKVRVRLGGWPEVYSNKSRKVQPSEPTPTPARSCTSASCTSEPFPHLILTSRSSS